MRTILKIHSRPRNSTRINVNIATLRPVFVLGLACIAFLGVGIAEEGSAETQVLASAECNNHDDSIVVLDDEAVDSAKSTECIDWVWREAKLSCRSGLKAVIALTNRCAVSIAFIVQPWELRVRSTEEQTFAYEWLSEASYSRLYILKSDIGRADMFFGDGGLKVRAWPDCVEVETGSTSHVELLVKPEHLGIIENSEYVIFVQTYILMPSGCTIIDGRRDRVRVGRCGVALHNLRHEPEPGRRVEIGTPHFESPEIAITVRDCSYPKEDLP